ncbi:T9SS type A sorting domain-containing protein [Arundinibacter roseus]|uniref:T9SS type A sorting domain-containing protein n=2 Tax=Arundinibacter roseus TaxID=2070510 RepID=A0A4R4KE00_9BACT|nr:T9SS type A sorting domain-containing protein [Arundinibacter roseus]
MGLFIKNRLTILSILLIISRVNTFSQPCETNFTLQPVQGNNSIEWDKFPQFTLPFTIIYNGPRFGDQNSRPLQHGFSHIAYFSGPENSTLPVKNRALLWNSVASVEVFQPWSVVGLESPWGNDTAIYRRHWDRYITDMANLFDDSRLSGIPRADIICLDVERMQELDRDILNLKRDNRIPEGYRSLADNTFMTTYKKDIRWWYTAPVNYLKNKGLPETTKLSSYSDVPVRGTWLNVTTNSWADWTSNTQRTHYLMQDDAGKIGGSFYNAMDILMPSAYYYYPYENPLGKDYLSYLLFQIEVNKAWSSKDIIPFVWLRYHDSFVPGAPQIPKFMAEATAIFPFFSGAKGLWLWDNNMFENTQQQNYSTYEHFIYGLYRLSQFSDMFQGNYELVIPQSARDHMQQRNPIWRGVVKDGKIVIAAQNTYAAENQNTELTVTYKQWTKTITLTGRDVFLCKFDLSDVVSALDSSLQVANVYPNPTDQKSVFVNLSSRSTHSNLTFELLDLKGVVLRTTQMPTQIGDIRYQFDLPIVPEGLYMLRISSENSSTSHSIFIKN